MHVSVILVSELQGAPDDDPGQGLAMLFICMPSETPGRYSTGEHVFTGSKSSGAHRAGNGELTHLSQTSCEKQRGQVRSPAPAPTGSFKEGEGSY